MNSAINCASILKHINQGESSPSFINKLKLQRKKKHKKGHFPEEYCEISHKVAFFLL